MTRTLGGPAGRVWGHTWGSGCIPSPLLSPPRMSATMEGGRWPRRWKEALETPALSPPRGSSPLSTFPLNAPGKEQEEGTRTAGQEGESEGGRLGREGRAQWPLWGVADGPDAISQHERGPRMCVLLGRGQGCVLGAGRWGKALRKT